MVAGYGQSMPLLCGMAEGISVFETVLGAPYETDAQLCFRRLFEAITGEVWTAEQAHAEEQRIRQLVLANEAQPGPPMQLTDVERALSHQVLAQLMHDTRLWCSNFFDWPMFDLILYGKGQRLAGDNALMLGSQESVESLAFIALSKEVYGADQAFIVDEVSGDNKRKHGNFAIGSPRQIPHEDGSMDLVHVNHVMDRTNVALDFSVRTEYLQGMMTEAARVLKPGGQLLMMEKIPSSSGVTIDHRNFATQYDDVKESIYRAWESAGFGQGGMTQAQQSMSLRNYLRNGLAICADSFMLHATKR